MKHQLTLVTVGLFLAIVAASTLVPVGSGASTVTHRQQQHKAAALGVYAGPSAVSAVMAFQFQIHSKVDYVMDFVDGSSWTSIAHPANLTAWSSLGYKTIWGVPMLPNSGGSLSVGATGAYNSYYASLARALVASRQGGDIIRIGWEFNGIWFPWSAPGKATQFIDYYRQIVTAMRGVPGAHFAFEWNPSRGDIGAGDLSEYWPGNSYVSYVGLDVFDVEWQTYPGWGLEFSHILTEPYGLNWFAAFAAQHHKPMVFPEWGLGWGTCSTRGIVTSSAAVCGGDNPSFIKSMSRWIATHNVFESSFWDYGTSRVNTSLNTATAGALRTYWATGDRPPRLRVSSKTPRAKT